ncbi:MAG: tRNA(Ile2) 2-agmatinylcytidine synthetase TiaS [Candidatus Heimdallarchaeota archaeon LC_2]|nr:MAG: tRNA(Ile2) 2-agmatinylcytidine synthetase TiaS [Candidatus Heimdallarchaeota archaeon LC_2]
MLIHLGLDSTDSPSSGCTTHTASKIMDALQIIDNDIRFIGYPKLVRLNPNIPIKTRGNAAIAFSVETNLNPERIFDIAKEIVKIDKETNIGEPEKKPGLVLKIGELTPQSFYFGGLHEVLTLKELQIMKLVDYYYPKEGNGLIGALCALFSDFSDDYTFELITYRKVKSLGTKRIIDIEALSFAEERYKSTFSSIDRKTKRELIAPSGPDPVFCGIRANDTSELHQFLQSLNVIEELDSWTIFQSNQATNAHVNDNLSNIIPYNVFSSELQIVSRHEEYQGGHIKLFTQIHGTNIECMVFEPTKELRDLARLLIPGDRIYAHGNVKENKFGTSISIEFFMVTHLELNIVTTSPICDCGTTKKSAGRYKGYKCPNCKKTSLIPTYNELERSPKLFLNQRVYASASAQRHLTKPISRLHKINNLPSEAILSYGDVRSKF